MPYLGYGAKINPGKAPLKSSLCECTSRIYESGQEMDNTRYKREGEGRLRRKTAYVTDSCPLLVIHAGPGYRLFVLGSHYTQLLPIAR